MAKRSRMEWVKHKLGFEGLITVDPVGKSGGLALMWKDKEQVEVRSFSKNHIDVKVISEDMYEWRLTGFYGDPDRAQRRNTWNLLRTLSRDANLPWCVIGDVNNVMSLNDKKGGDAYPEWLVEGFNDVVHEAGLIDLQLTGHQFTWERNRGTQDWIEVRLDRALITKGWLDKFPMAKVYNLEGAPSDHSAILLVPQVHSKSAKKYRFKFENAWLTEPMCAQIIREGWQGNQEITIQEKIKSCSEKLALWGREITGNFSGRIKACKEDLTRYKAGRDALSVERYKNAKKQQELIYNQREIFWRQRSKQLWLQAGDKNSNTFIRQQVIEREQIEFISFKIRKDSGWIGRVGYLI